MKNLATCKPTEFLAQTMKIRRLVADWLDVTKLFELLDKMPKREPDMTEEEYKKVVMQAMKGSFMKIFDKIFEENADKTLALLALTNFIEPENVDDHTMGEYLKNIGEMLNDENVLSFFLSLERLGQMNI